MADLPISGLPAGASVLATDIYPATDTIAGTTKKYTLAQLKTFVDAAALTATAVGFGSAGNILTGNATNFTWTDATKVLKISGALAKVDLQDANNNVVVGNGAGGALSGVGTTNTFMGFEAGSLSDGNASVFVGYKAGQENTGNNNSALGFGALQKNTTGIDNCAFGYSALFTNTTSNNSAAFGYNALTASTGTQNSAFGSNAGVSVSTGAANVCIGYNAGSTITTGGSNTVLGAGTDGITTSSYCIVLGAGAAATGSNQLVIGSAVGGQGITLSGTVTNGAGIPVLTPSDFLPVLVNGSAYKIMLFQS